MNGMSRLSAHNMRGQSERPGWCIVCGRPYPEGHHVVARSLGGGNGPVVELCGRGNNLRDADGNLLHHGAAETHRLWLWWHDGTDSDIAPKCLRGCGYGRWAYILADEPCRYEEAAEMEGWRLA